MSENCRGDFLTHTAYNFQLHCLNLKAGAFFSETQCIIMRVKTDAQRR